MRDVLSLTQALIRRPSVTPDDAGCQDQMAQFLEACGFHCERVDRGGVANLVARLGNGAPHIAFAGHTDVVPTGPIELWTSKPFEPEIRDGYLYGRGAADMKASLAAMLSAAQELAADIGTRDAGTLWFLITSDEEGPAVDGTVAIMEWLANRSIQLDYCIVGEPSCSERLGDIARCGRRGSINAELTVTGIQGHVAYPEQVRNPIHEMLPVLASISQLEWPAPYPDFPLTTLQVANLAAGTGASNVVPGDASAQFNVRFNPGYTDQDIRERVEALCLSDHCHLDWNLSGQPFYTPPGALRKALASAVLDETGVSVEFNTGGGTSDGRFIAPAGIEVVEFGPRNDTIHKIDERVAVAELEPLKAIYRETVARLLQSGPRDRTDGA
ncbi:MAG: succinyl-diaminopimelate desuccinylase [Pseudomonadaceae bacterium]|nr:succinyl-diaminopimelate desuccinylase [Pseudomonadaceae bacterium]